MNLQIGLVGRRLDGEGRDEETNYFNEIEDYPRRAKRLY